MEDLEARLDATVTAALKIAEEAERQKRLVEPYGPSRVDLVSPEKFWPRSHPYPKLIAEMGRTMQPWIKDSVGRFDMIGHRMSDTWIDHGTDLAEQFGFFLVDRNYRSVAVWYHEGAVPGSEPVVDFRSMPFDLDEDVALTAPTLNDYFTTWAKAVASGDDTYGLNPEPEIAALRPALAQRMLDLIASLPDSPPPVPAPDFVAFIRAHIARQRARDAADPVLQKMADLLRPRFPAPADVLTNSIFATVKGDAMEYSLVGQELTPETFPEGAALTPLLFQARAARAAGPTAPLGPWSSAQLSLFPDGRIALSAFWDD
jgi:hypothetical protein